MAQPTIRKVTFNDSPEYWLVAADEEGGDVSILEMGTKEECETSLADYLSQEGHAGYFQFYVLQALQEVQIEPQPVREGV